MPWYYAGPEAKPVGPLSLEELHARRAGGLLSPETYVIEHTGQPDEPRTWKRYRELFPSNPSLPPLPPAFSPPATPPPPPPQPHPLFPSAASASTQRSVFPPTPRPDPYYDSVRKTNSWCGWGFWLSLASLPLLIACGLGAPVALVALFLCLGGLAQVYHHPEQAGWRRALCGLLLSGLTLLITILFLAWAIPAAIKARGQMTVTEQTTSDSE